MKTLVFNGSTKSGGDTEALINELVSNLSGEIKTISRKDDISPCTDCRFCWVSGRFSIDDDMQEVYRYLTDCDNIVFASPVWFSTLSGPALNLASRLQAFYAAGHFRDEKIIIKEKRGVIVITGAQRGTEEMPFKTAVTIMKHMNVNRSGILKISSMDTNSLPACNDTVILGECRKAAEILNTDNKKG